MKFSLPNILSLTRIVLAPLILYLIVEGSFASLVYAVILFIIGALSDFFDGWAARKIKDVTSWGKFFDPLADKFLITAGFIAFVVLGILPLWMILIIVLRDILTTGFRFYSKKVSAQISTSGSAKWKTLIQMLFISYILVLLLLLRSSDDKIVIGFWEYMIWDSPVNYFVMLLITLFTVWTLVEYLFRNRAMIADMILAARGSRRIKYGIVSLFGIGFIPFAPGTFGSVVALSVLLLPDSIRFPAILGILIAAIALAFPLIKEVERSAGPDPGFIVIDEAIGVWLLFLSPYIPMNLTWIIIGFCLFRLFDIIKPFPINRINAKKGALYVIADDVVAAILASIILHLFILASRIMPFALLWAGE